jgi:hypothetical protein
LYGNRLRGIKGVLTAQIRVLRNIFSKAKARVSYTVNIGVFPGNRAEFGKAVGTEKPVMAYLRASGS